MSEITLRILDGADRGRVFENIVPPISLGREEGNTIQLNDERVSRFHAKIQIDHGDIVLTDLESTNGTRVNGEQTQLKILRFGDTITIGRSTILIGSRDDIRQRLRKISDTNSVNRQRTESSISNSFEAAEAVPVDSTDLQLNLLESEPPVLPERLSPGQAAQLSEMLDFLHLRLRKVIRKASQSDSGNAVTINQKQWQNLLELQSRISEYLRAVGRPSE